MDFQLTSKQTQVFEQIINLIRLFDNNNLSKLSELNLLVTCKHQCNTLSQ